MRRCFLSRLRGRCFRSLAKHRSGEFSRGCRWADGKHTAEAEIERLHRERARRWKRRTPIRRTMNTTPAASAWSPRSTASRAARSSKLRIDALKSVWHRGAVDADGKTGDGAGIHVEVPQDFFARAGGSAPATILRDGASAIGMIFLPRTDFGARSAAARSSRPRSCASASISMAGVRCRSTFQRDRREGQRHAPRDRADHVRRGPQA